MPGKIQARNAVPAPVPLLFFIADTGGGHRNAAAAIGQALDRRYPGRFAPVLTDPLGGSGSAPLLRWITGGYGPVIRLAPWLWGAAYYASNSRPAMRLLRGALLRLADRPAVAAVARVRPAVLVSFHPLTGTSAVRARDLIAPGTPVITVVTDLGAPHAAWRQAGVDLIIGPSATDRGPSAGDGRPSAADRRPSAADGRPSAADRRPSAADGRPSAADAGHRRRPGRGGRTAGPRDFWARGGPPSARCSGGLWACRNTGSWCC